MPDVRPESIPSPAAEPYSSRWFEIARVFLKLGCTSFGGPLAHLGYLRRELVEKQRWLDDHAYADLVALAQLLPGPTSSQTVFGLGLRRGGLVGACIASCCFTLPSALLMTAFAYGVAQVGDLSAQGWIHGLKFAAVGVVAQAVRGMSHKLCPDAPRLLLALTAALILTYFPGAWVQLATIFGGALLGWLIYRHAFNENPAVREPVAAHASATVRRNGLLALLIFFAVLVASPWLALKTEQRQLQEFDVFYRSGALVFGGGHVILPLLRAELEPHQWLSTDQLLAGYAAAQAVPGPLNTFSAYLGTVMYSATQPDRAWLGGLWCLFAIFLPGLLLIGGALPFWDALKRKTWTRAALHGANATVVGVLLAAFYKPVLKESIGGWPDALTAILAFAALEFAKAPPLLVVLLAAAAGQWILQ